MTPEEKEIERIKNNLKKKYERLGQLQAQFEDEYVFQKKINNYMFILFQTVNIVLLICQIVWLKNILVFICLEGISLCIQKLISIWMKQRLATLDERIQNEMKKI